MYTIWDVYISKIAIWYIDSPEIFISLLNKYFDDIENVEIYFDDILISADTKEEHDKILNQVIERTRKYNIRFNSEKMHYAKNEVKFLGYVFNEFGMKADNDRVKSILNLKNPTCKKKLQRILGMINYLRDFLPNLSEVISPLRQLLKKDIIWNWSTSHSAALNEIKMLLSNASILVNFDPKESIKIQCDASMDALGACLIQNRKSVCFLSRSLSDTEESYAQIEKELLAITFACEKLHNYIYGHKNITVYSDHQPLISIINKNIDKIHNNRLKRLRVKILLYTFELKYLPGKYMFIADLLSKNNITEKVEDKTLKDVVHTAEITQIKFSQEKSDEFKSAVLNDPTLKKVIEYYQKGSPKNKSNFHNNAELTLF